MKYQCTTSLPLCLSTTFESAAILSKAPAMAINLG
jgi:hypothetical protein